MDIKEKIEEIVAKLKGDKNLTRSFKKNPVKTIEDLIGVDLPDEQIEKIVEAVKAKISAGGFIEKIKGLFRKK